MKQIIEQVKDLIENYVNHIHLTQKFYDDFGLLLKNIGENQKIEFIDNIIEYYNSTNNINEDVKTAALHILTVYREQNK